MALIIVPKSTQEPNIQNMYNYNINANGNAKINAGNVTDNSVTNITLCPPEVFEQTRKLILDLHSADQQQLLDILSQIEATHKANNKQDCGNWFGKFISLASIADCITVAQPIAGILAWLLA